MKKLIITISFSLASVWLYAQDTIQFTWKGSTNKGFRIGFTTNDPFIVYWGDGTYNTYSSRVLIEYDYADTIDYTVTIVATTDSCRFWFFHCNPDCDNIYDPFNNQISNLDVSRSRALIGLACNYSNLTSLNINGCTKLKMLDCSNNNLTSLDVSSCTELWRLFCNNNQLSNLDVNLNMELNHFVSDNNCLPLSNLYIVYKLMIDGYGYGLSLGTQRLLSREVVVGDTVDFSTQAKFGNPDTLTVFVVEKDSMPAVIDVDYSINNGIITFKDIGTYTITMTNDAVKYGAEVIAEIKVIKKDVGINELSVVSGQLLVYPNPTNNQLRITRKYKY